MPAEVFENRTVIIAARLLYVWDEIPACSECFRIAGLTTEGLEPIPVTPTLYCHYCGDYPREETYCLVRTDAPEAYDGFGTYTYTDHAGATPPGLSPVSEWPCRVGWVEADPTKSGIQMRRHRIVAVKPESMYWQEQRNRSGLHWWVPVEPEEEL